MLSHFNVERMVWKCILRFKLVLKIISLDSFQPREENEIAGPLSPSPQEGFNDDGPHFSFPDFGMTGKTQSVYSKRH